MVNNAITHRDLKPANIFIGIQTLLECVFIYKL